MPTPAAHSVNWPLYMVIRLLFVPFFLIYFRLSRTGREYARNIDGGLIVAANHRSFLDPFVVGAMLPFRRPMNYVAKVELFEKPWQAWFLSRLGAFPIRRGLSDEQSMETARMSSNAAGRSASSPRAPAIAAAASPTRSAASAGWRCRPARRSCRPPSSAPKKCAAAGASGRAR